MTSDEPIYSGASALFPPSDLETIQAQLKKRWIILLTVTALVGAVIIAAAFWRNEALTISMTIAMGAAFIFCFDLLLKPLHCYKKHLNNVMSGRRRVVTLPYMGISEDVNLVEGVRYRTLLCLDYDGKGRPYDRMFYYDAEKAAPEFAPETQVTVVHHDLDVADIYAAEQ